LIFPIVTTFFYLFAFLHVLAYINSSPDILAPSSRENFKDGGFTVETEKKKQNIFK